MCAMPTAPLMCRRFLRDLGDADRLAARRGAVPRPQTSRLATIARLRIAELHDEAGQRAMHALAVVEALPHQRRRCARRSSALRWERFRTQTCPSRFRRRSTGRSAFGCRGGSGAAASASSTESDAPRGSHDALTCVRPPCASARGAMSCVTPTRRAGTIGKHAVRAPRSRPAGRRSVPR